MLVGLELELLEVTRRSLEPEVTSGMDRFGSSLIGKIDKKIEMIGR